MCACLAATTSRRSAFDALTFSCRLSCHRALERERERKRARQSKKRAVVSLEQRRCVEWARQARQLPIERVNQLALQCKMPIDKRRKQGKKKRIGALFVVSMLLLQLHVSLVKHVPVWACVCDVLEAIESVKSVKNKTRQKDICGGGKKRDEGGDGKGKSGQLHSSGDHKRKRINTFSSV